MRCKDIGKLRSEYLDGELDVERSSAVRGHLRQCEGCRSDFEAERALAEAAAELEPIEPPARVWHGIQSRLAEEEQRDSERGAWWWRWRRLRFSLAGAALASCALLLVLGSQGSGGSELGDSRRAAEPPGESEARVRVTHQARTSVQLSRSDQRYLATIAELREMLKNDRKRFQVDTWSRIEERLRRYEKRAVELRLALAPSAHRPESRDALYRSYRDQIRYLQLALAGEVDSL